VQGGRWLGIGLLAAGLLALGWWSNQTNRFHWRVQRLHIHTAALRPFTDTVQLRRHLERALRDTSLSIGEALRRVDSIVRQETYVRALAVKADYSGTLEIFVDERIPLFRVIPRKGRAFYLSADHVMLPISGRTSVHALVIAGDLKVEYKKGGRIEKGPLKKALRLAEAFLMHPYWKNQVAYIYVDSDGQLSIGERVGRYRAFLGSNLEELDQQLSLLEKILPYVYESRYRFIDLRYPKQAIVK